MVDKAILRKGEPVNKSRIATKSQRLALLLIQDYKCNICGKELEADFQVDHIIPFSLGGTTTIPNLQGVCRSCHHSKTKTDLSLIFQK